MSQQLGGVDVLLGLGLIVLVSIAAGLILVAAIGAGVWVAIARLGRSLDRIAYRPGGNTRDRANGRGARHG